MCYIVYSARSIFFLPHIYMRAAMTSWALWPAISVCLAKYCVLNISVLLVSIGGAVYNHLVVVYIARFKDIRT